jgi:hypothetical protein
MTTLQLPSKTVRAGAVLARSMTQVNTKTLARSRWPVIDASVRSLPGNSDRGLEVYHVCDHGPGEPPIAGENLARGDKTLAQNNKTAVGSSRMWSRIWGACFPGWRSKDIARSNMSDQPVSDAQYFRDPAEKAGAKADHTLDDATKQIWLRIAETYERVAERAQQRLPDAEKPH